MHDPPLCELWQLRETGPHTYSINDLADMHEAMDEEAEYIRRAEAKHKR